MYKWLATWVPGYLGWQESRYSLPTTFRVCQRVFRSKTGDDISDHVVGHPESQPHPVWTPPESSKTEADDRT